LFFHKKVLLYHYNDCFFTKKYRCTPTTDVFFGGYGKISAQKVPPQPIFHYLGGAEAAAPAKRETKQQVKP